VVTPALADLFRNLGVHLIVNRPNFTLPRADASSFLPVRELLDSVTAGLTREDQQRLAVPASARRSVEAQEPAPTIKNSTFTDHNASAVPTVTGSVAAANAHQPSGESSERLRASTRINPMAKQMAGLTITVSIQNKGVADQLGLNPVVA